MQKSDDVREKPVYGKLKDIRELFGLSPNGFRLYEREGLVSTTRNADNDYRIASLGDGVLLCNAFSMTHYGISLQQTHRMLDGILEDQISTLDAMNASMDRELRLLMAKKIHLEERLRALNEYARDPFACSVTDSASIGFIRLHGQDMRFDYEVYEDCKVWWQAAPLVDAGLIVLVDEHGNARHVDHGPCAGRGASLMYGLPMRYATSFCQEGKRYLHAYAYFCVEKLPTAETYEHMFAYMDMHGLALQGEEILHRLLRHETREGLAMRLDEVYLPLRG